jgi:hypothetical protein
MTPRLAGYDPCMTPRPPRLAAVVSIAVLALGTAACGGDDSSSATDPSAKSSSSAAAADTAGGELTQASFFTAITDAQTKAGTSHVALQLGSGDQEIKADGEVEVGRTVADTAISMTMDMGSAGAGKIAMVIVDNTFYINLGQMTGDKFAKVNLEDDSNPIAKQFGSITDQLDPSRQLAQFKDAVTSLKKSGAPKKIGGVKAQPYEIVLDTTKIKAFDELPAGAEASVPKTLTYTMFVDSDHLLRRVQADVAGSAVTVTYSKWGEPVDVKAPPSSQLSDLDLSKMGTAGS